ncbi:serine threonine- phosphatase PGAM5, mitochondrial isoform X2 [Pelobates cultripes]|uniref:Serine/threonine-protein phosphatase PGAM5, mitochondrial n=1 Tax=Pelobates cultripes TaxID=61616 RepID=A0AAD1WAZ5_PELCU|nr:serine threonine- phosphatase PGAM5, mitochondrial isoform X2 [Pelobates cultripes]CAH2300752.1 serine threonine- phosphatase PGAM5, mitochondrial isoform X2 [Pelobates cultripes]
MFLRRAVIAAGGSAVALFAAVSVGKSGDDYFLAWPPAVSERWESNWDLREPNSLINLNHLKEKPEELKHQLDRHKAKATRHIFLVRHAQYNEDGATDSEKILTEEGRKQAEHTGKRLASLHHTFTYIIYSSMARTKETFEIIKRKLPDIENSGCDLLREGYPIKPVPLSSHWKADYKFFKDGPRLEAAFRKYICRADPKQAKDSYEIIVCHENVIRYIVCRALQLPPEAWKRMSLHHGSISKLVIYPDGEVLLEMLGDVGFLPVDKLEEV